MNIATIQSITPKGSFPSAHGTMFSFTVAFSDGVSGEANSKSQTPPYKVGQQVGYEIKSTHPQYGHKLKIDVKAAQGGTNTPPAQQNPANPAQSAQNGHQASASIHPATAGCAFKAAVEVLNSYEPKGAEDAKAVWQLASKYVRILQALEAGKLAKEPVPAPVAAAQATAMAHGFVPAAAPTGAPPAGGMAYHADSEALDLDVPF